MTARILCGLAGVLCAAAVASAQPAASTQAAATGLKIEEFARLLPAFESAYHALYPLNQTAEGKTRQRLPGGGTKGTRRTVEDKLLFILVYQKTYPLQTMHGLQFGLSQPQTHYWIHRLLPVLQRARADLNMTPEREGEYVAPSELVNEHAPDRLIDGSAPADYFQWISPSTSTPAKWSI